VEQDLARPGIPGFAQLCSFAMDGRLGSLGGSDRSYSVSRELSVRYGGAVVRPAGKVFVRRAATLAVVGVTLNELKAVRSM
jgi:hypothetical protein